MTTFFLLTAVTNAVYVDNFRLENKLGRAVSTLNWIGVSFNLRLDNSHQYALDYISVQGAIVLKTGTLMMPMFSDLDRDCSPSLASRTTRLPRRRRVTSSKPRPRARGRRFLEPEAISRGKKIAVNPLLQSRENIAAHATVRLHHFFF